LAAKTFISLLLSPGGGAAELITERNLIYPVLNINKMKIFSYRDYKALSIQAADLIIQTVQRRPASTLCIASGHTPTAALERMAEMALAGQADFSHCHFIGLDEWVGIPLSAEGSCRYFLDKYFFKKMNIPEEQLHFFDGMATDLEAECQKMDDTISRLGGLDLLLVGIGMNGHIALNEPGTPWHLYSHVSELDEMTVTVGQKYFTQKTRLTKGITLGLQYLREARLPVLMASGEAKASVIRQALWGEVTEQLPASIFQTLEHSIVLLDEAAAGDL
jgi:galactosamine-6-phosphate isomerase/glucosamine-6-phosphate deaminase